MSAVESTAIPTVLPLADTAQAVPAGRSSGVAAGHVLPRLARMRARHVRWVLWTGLAVAFAVTCGEVGLPTDRVVLLGWALTGLVAHAAVDGWRRVVGLLTEWLPVAALLLAYDASRGLADGLGMPVHVSEPAAVDRWLGFGALPTAVLQQHWDADWWKALAALVYGSHFVITPLLLCVLWVRDRRLWGRYVRRVLALSAAGLITYVLYPAAPPWLAAKDGVIEPVRRLSATGWDVLGMPHAGALLAESQAQVNKVAAVPSLHTAFAVLVCLVLFPVARRAWMRAGLIAYALVMPLVLVWSGEHYVIDTLLGALYAAGVVLAAALTRPAVAAVRRRVQLDRCPEAPTSAAPTVEA